MYCHHRGNGRRSPRPKTVANMDNNNCTRSGWRANGPRLNLSPDLSELVYRGEGNATIVVAHPSTRQVLRLRKYKPEPERSTKLKSSCSDPLNHSCCSCLTLNKILTIHKLHKRKQKKPPKSLNLAFLYVDTVMKKLLGSRFLPNLNVIHMTSDKLHEVSELIRPSRPEYRLENDVDCGYHQVIVASDCALLPPAVASTAYLDTLCIEIKAKCGFVPKSSSAFVAPKIRSKLCRFCLLQYHLKKSTRYVKRSGYCPCDLFSGQENRMIHALKALISTPQINFRVFLNGTLRYSHDSSLADLHSCLDTFLRPIHGDLGSDEMEGILVSLLRQILCYPYKKDSATQKFKYATTCNYTHHCKGSSSWGTAEHDQGTKLSVNSVLGRILRVQLLDSLFIDGVMPHYRRLAAFMTEREIEWEKVFLYSIHADPGEDNLFSFVKSHDESPEIAYAAEVYSQYLHASVAKDCSIMIAIQPAKKGSSHSSASSVKDDKNGSYVFNCSIVDLDPKPFHKIKRHFKEEIEASQSYKEAKKKGSTC